MTYKPRTLHRLIEEMNTNLFLPHIQRPFVWDVDQMKRLFDSLMRDYPIQTLLFWRTTAAIKARKFMTSVEWDGNLSEYYDEPNSQDGVDRVFVLDGQQRLQTLYALFRGAIRSDDGRQDLFAYAKVTDGGEPDEDGLVHHVVFAGEHPGAEFYRLSDLFGRDARREREDIQERLNEALDEALDETPEDRKTRHRNVNRNVGRVVSLLREEKHFWIEELDGIANDYPYERVLDIFVRVNSGGTKLDAADLMFAAMKTGWDEVEERVEAIADMLSETALAFDKSMVLKCLVVANGMGSELTPKKFQSKTLLDAIEANWERSEATFQQLRDFIKHDLKLYGAKVVRSYGAFVPLFDYLYHNPKPDESSRRLMAAYHYKAQLFNWFGAGTDQIINAVHNIVGTSGLDGFPLGRITAYFSGRRDWELTKEHLLQSRTRHILLNIVYAHEFGASPFDVMYSGNAPHIDHIFPQSPLRTRLGYGTSDINHLGNFRFVGATDNIRKRAEEPGKYFARLKAAGIPIEKHLLLPDYASDPTSLQFTSEVYEDFRNRRFERLFQILARVINPETATSE